MPGPLGGVMLALRTAVATGLTAVILSGCVAPGSSIGYLSIRGQLTSDDGLPLAERDLQFLLPAAYGLGGLDLVLNKPEDFGHQDQVFTVRTGSDGEFSHDLGQHIYHMSFWLIPPLGGFPRHPPAPFLLVRAMDAPGEYYAVQTHDGKFKIFTDHGAELSIEEAQLSKLVARKEYGNSETWRWTAGIIDLSLAGAFAQSHAAQQGDEVGR